MKRDTLLKECMAEFIGMYVILFFGAGSVAAMVFKQNYNSFWELSLMWGIAVTLGIYIAGGISGAHLNTAVTISLAVFKGFPVKKILPYTAAQILGAFAGAASVYGLYYKNFQAWESAQGILRGSAASKGDASIFYTFPQDGLGNFNACIVEIFITALLMIVILAVSDEKNPVAPGAGMSSVIIGLTIAVIGGTFGGLTGFALNPARDFGPRVFAAIMGWGDVALPGPDGYFWVPIIAPIIGAIIGGFIYQKVIHRSLELKEKLENQIDEAA